MIAPLFYRNSRHFWIALKQIPHIVILRFLNVVWRQWNSTFDESSQIMRISHTHKFIFLALPRTGSTTVRQVLDQYSDIKSVRNSDKTDEFPFYHHIPATELKGIFQQKDWKWEDYNRFCVVRNPWDRMVSLYHHHLKQRSIRVNKSLLSNLRDTFTPAPTFKQYVFRVHSLKGLAVSLEHFIGAASNTDKPLVDHILRFEELDKELPRYLENLNINIHSADIPHLNASRQPKQLPEILLHQNPKPGQCALSIRNRAIRLFILIAQARICHPAIIDPVLRL